MKFAVRKWNNQIIARGENLGSFDEDKFYIISYDPTPEELQQLKENYIAHWQKKLVLEENPLAKNEKEKQIKKDKVKDIKKLLEENPTQNNLINAIKDLCNLI